MKTSDKGRYLFAIVKIPINTKRERKASHNNLLHKIPIINTKRPIGTPIIFFLESFIFIDIFREKYQPISQLGFALLLHNRPLYLKSRSKSTKDNRIKARFFPNIWFLDILGQELPIAKYQNLINPPLWCLV